MEEIPSAGSHFRTSLDHLRSSLRWLVAAAGATAAALVAGLQLTHLATLPWLLAASAAVAVLIALGVTFMFLLATAKVLTLDRLTAPELSNREAHAKVVPGGLRLGEVKDPLVQWILERRTYLLGSASSVTELYSVGLIASTKAAEQLRQGNPVSWQGRELRPDSTEDAAIIGTAIQDAERHIEMTEDAAHFAITDIAYRSLLEKVPKWSGVFCLSVIAFAVIPALAPAKVSAPVTAPTPVRVIILDAKRAGLNPGCGAETSGVAVGGTLERPVVALPGTGDCPAKVLDRVDGVVVVPIVTSSG